MTFFSWLVFLFIQSSYSQSLPKTPSDFQSLLQKSLLFIDAQWSGTRPTNLPPSWVTNSGTQDGSDNGANLTGGFYQSYNHLKITYPMASSITTLCWSAIANMPGYAAAGANSSIDGILKNGLNYLFNASKNTSGIWYMVGDPSQESNPASWGSEPTARPSYFIGINSNPIHLYAEVSAALACGALYLNAEPNLAAQYYTVATSLYRAASAMKLSAGKSTPEPNVPPRYVTKGSVYDKLAWAALWIQMSASGNAKEIILGEAEAFVKLLPNVTSLTFNWDDRSIGCYLMLYLFTNETMYFNSLETWFLNMISYQNNPYTKGGLLWTDPNSPIEQVAFVSLIIMYWKNVLQNGYVGEKILCDFVWSQIFYIFGNNPTKQSYMVGTANGPSNPYHIAAHGGTDINTPATNANVLTGAMVNGPDQSDNFVDSRNNPSNTMVGLEINAPMIAILAAFSDSRFFPSFVGDPNNKPPLSGESANSNNTGLIVLLVFLILLVILIGVIFYYLIHHKKVRSWKDFKNLFNRRPTTVYRDEESDIFNS